MADRLNHAEEPFRCRAFYTRKAAVLLSLEFLLIGLWFAVSNTHKQNVLAYEPIAVLVKSSSDMLVQSPSQQAREITNEIKNAASVEMLLCTYSAHQQVLDGIHLSAFWMALTRLSKRRDVLLWLQANV
eukprot:gnl/TRDRNA2_/TRDRNA2_176473_c1_seq7.p1 gnl/TRDRNA2_/TRDRNA2_176473_c1~~gnl/TRDRNA2_/TRDRNA2_176473_c1_seq7.p1  ORF type:complete len:140 (+),score=16.09 gnl/TRDRNA2_/TRDRNA2_176473_c1_seq7:35-421(+)